MSPVKPKVSAFDIILPEDYFWIPGFEGRYALFYSQNMKRLEEVVLSFITPGQVGRPTRIWAKNGLNGMNGVYALRAHKGYQPVTFTLGSLTRMVQESTAYIAARRKKPVKAAVAPSVDSKPVLPENYFWIPGYENRYALQYLPKSKELIKSVYSFTYPGDVGVPVAISYAYLRGAGNGEPVYYLSKNGWKDPYALAELLNYVRNSKEFKDKTAVKKVDTTPTIVTKGLSLVENHYWIPQYEGRYALAYVPAQKVFIPQVYKYELVRSSNSYTVMPVAGDRACDKVAFTLKNASGNRTLAFVFLENCVRQGSAAFRERNRTIKTADETAKADAESKASWVIGYSTPSAPAELKMVLGQLGVIQRFGSEAEASKTAESCAKNGPGNTYTVFKAACQFQTGGVTRTELK